MKHRGQEFFLIIVITSTVSYRGMTPNALQKFEPCNKAYILNEILLAKNIKFTFVFCRF
ncbi:hypothetical protein [Rickettsia endosymbiont of Orchestes rusci]|uniref:hypothetical protein n=1 Tax=Rickettsia endosymbiont of Orchestes rusci TaxID=3066250 RepID=UPI00313BFBD4